MPLQVLYEPILLPDRFYAPNVNFEFHKIGILVPVFYEVRISYNRVFQALQRWGLKSTGIKI